MSHPIDIDAAKNVVGAVCVAHTHTAHHARSCRVDGMYSQNSAGSGRATHYERTNGGAQAPGQRSRPTALERTSSIRCHHRIKTFHGGPGGWRDEQLPDGTIVWTSPTGRIYRTTPGGPELFPQMRPACGTNAAQAQPVEGERGPDCPRCNKIREQRPVNAEQRRVNRARRQEIADRKWRNHMRKMLVLFKGSEPSTLADSGGRGSARRARRAGRSPTDRQRRPGAGHRAAGLAGRP